MSSEFILGDLSPKKEIDYAYGGEENE